MVTGSTTRAGNRTDAAKTWWGQRWMAVLERLVDAARLSQGRWHARTGRVVRLDVTRGGVIARVEGGRAVPRTVSVRLAPLSDAQWARVLGAMAAQARYSAQLQAGEMPDEIEAVFEAAGASLFPRNGGGVSLTCTCSEARRGLGPCKHAAAVCYALAERLDADPFVLFELRGRTREQIAAALRARRTIGALQDAPAARERAAPIGFWACPGGPADLEAVEALVAVPGSLPAGDAEAILPLGPPPFWPDRDAYSATMAGAYRAIAEHAHEVVEHARER